MTDGADITTDRSRALPLRIVSLLVSALLAIAGVAAMFPGYTFRVIPREVLWAPGQDQALVASFLLSLSILSAPIPGRGRYALAIACGVGTYVLSLAHLGRVSAAIF